jgi:hypothetical protein
MYSSPYTDQHLDHIYNLSQNSASLQVVLLFLAILISKFKQLGPVIPCAAVVKGEIPPMKTLKAHKSHDRAPLILHLGTKWG